MRCRRELPVTGGLGAGRLETARWLVERGASAWSSRVAARSCRASAGTRRSSVLAADIGGSVRGGWSRWARTVEVVALDAADETACADSCGTDCDRTATAARYRARGRGHRRLPLVVELDVPKLAKVLRPKLVGANVPERATRGVALDFLVLHLVARQSAGQPGHLSYAAANAFRMACGRCPPARTACACRELGGVGDLGLRRPEAAAGPSANPERRGICSFPCRGGHTGPQPTARRDAITAVVAPADWRRFVEASRKTRCLR